MAWGWVPIVMVGPTGFDPLWSFSTAAWSAGDVVSVPENSQTKATQLPAVLVVAVIVVTPALVFRIYQTSLTPLPVDVQRALGNCVVVSPAPSPTAEKVTVEPALNRTMTRR